MKKTKRQKLIKIVKKKILIYKQTERKIKRIPFKIRKEIIKKSNTGLGRIYKLKEIEYHLPDKLEPVWVDPMWIWVRQ